MSLQSILKLHSFLEFCISALTDITEIGIAGKWLKFLIVAHRLNFMALLWTVLKRVTVKHSPIFHSPSFLLWKALYKNKCNWTELEVWFLIQILTINQYCTDDILLFLIQPHIICVCVCACMYIYTHSSVSRNPMAWGTKLLWSLLKLLWML